MGSVTPRRWPIRLLRGAVGTNAALQGLMGGLGFALAPAALFPGIGLDTTGHFAFRLAGFTNLTVAAFALWAALRLPVPFLRVLSLCMGAYHVLAGAEGWSQIGLGGPVADVATGALPFHVLSAAALIVAALSSRARTADRCTCLLHEVPHGQGT